jgi:hypothetical protein
MGSVQLQGRREAYLVVSVDDHVLSNNFSVVRRPISGGRYDSGRKQHGKNGRHLGRIFLRKGDEIIEGFLSISPAYDFIGWSIWKRDEYCYTRLLQGEPWTGARARA